MQRVSKAKAKIQEKKNRKRLHIWQVHDSVQNTSQGQVQKKINVNTSILLKPSNFPLVHTTEYFSNPFARYNHHGNQLDIKTQLSSYPFSHSLV